MMCFRISTQNYHVFLIKQYKSLHYFDHEVRFSLYFEFLFFCILLSLVQIMFILFCNLLLLIQSYCKLLIIFLLVHFNLFNLNLQLHKLSNLEDLYVLSLYTYHEYLLFIILLILS